MCRPMGQTTGAGHQRWPCALIVDDHAVNRLLLRTVLSKLGFECFECVNGLQALQFMRRAKPQVCLVLLDLQMPVLDGWATAQCLRAEHGMSLPIIACTASDLSATAGQAGGSDTSVQQHALNCGMDMCLAKPLSVQQMAAALQQLHISTPELAAAAAAAVALITSTTASVASGFTQSAPPQPTGLSA